MMTNHKTHKPACRYESSDDMLYITCATGTYKISAWPPYARKLNELGEWASAIPNLEAIMSWHKQLTFRALRLFDKILAESQMYLPYDVPTRAANERIRRSVQAAIIYSRLTATRSALGKFINQIPLQAIASLESYNSSRWELLLLLFDSPDEYIQFSYRNKSLLFFIATSRPLANQNTFYQKRTEIIEKLGLPGNESTVKIVSKLIPELLRPGHLSLLKKVLHNNVAAAQLLRHLSLINPTSLTLLCPDVFEQLRDAYVVKILSTAHDQTELMHKLSTVSCTTAIDYPSLISSTETIEELYDIHTLHQATMAFWHTTASVQPPYTGNSHIQPLDTLDKIHVQAHALVHCIFSTAYLCDIAEKKIFLYKYVDEKNNVSATIGLRKNDENIWCLDSIKGRRNRRVSEKVLKDIVGWFEGVTLLYLTEDKIEVIVA